MSEETWALIAVVAASTLIGGALAFRGSWTRARAVIQLTQREFATPPMPAAAIGEPQCEAKDGIWTCTRSPHRKGDHGAHGNSSTVPIHTWPRKPGEDQ